MKRGSLLARGQVPQFHGGVVAAGRDGLAIREEGHISQSSRLLAERLLRTARRRIEQAHPPVISCSSQRPAVRRKHERIDVFSGTEMLIRSLPVATSHSRTVRSLVAEAKVRPSGEKATDQMRSVCPVRVARFFRVAKSQRVTALVV